MAKALYDNIPESAEELLFRKGDVLTVIEQNTGGLEGWWLCSLHGRQGIAPGNRLKLMVGPIYEGSEAGGTSAEAQGAYQIPVGRQGPPGSGSPYRDPIYQVPPQHGGQGIYQVPPAPISHTPQGHETYQVPPSIQRTTWGAEGTPPTSKVMTPIRCGQGYVYDSLSRQKMYDVPAAHHQGLYDIPPSVLKGATHQIQAEGFRSRGLYSIPSSLAKDNQSLYDVPPSVYKETFGGGDKESNYDFPPPMRHLADPLSCPKAEGLYDIPPASVKPPAPGHPVGSVKQSIYDVPPAVASSELLSSRLCGVYDIPSAGQRPSPQGDVYDVPRGVLELGRPATPGDGASSVYDVPPRVSQDGAAAAAADGMNRLSFSSTGSTRSNMSTSSSTTSKESSVCASPVPEKKAPPGGDPDSAFDRLNQLQQALDGSVRGLQAFVSPDWRSYEAMGKNLNDIHAAVDKVKHSLQGFMAFAQGALANAARLPDSALHNKLRKQLQRLDDSYQILLHTGQALDNSNWSLNLLLANRPLGKSDHLDRFLMVSKMVPDDARQLASSVSANAELLFRPNGGSGGGSGIVGATNLQTVHEMNQGPADDQASTNCNQTHPQADQTLIQIQSLYGPPHRDHQDHGKNKELFDKSWMEDYDYVHLQGKDEFERQQRELLEKENIIKQNKVPLEQHQLNQFQELEKEVTKPVENDLSKWKVRHHVPQKSSSLGPQDKQLLVFYSEQCETHFVTLLNAIDAFFSSISSGQPPRIFVAHSKFIILSAHKLVFIGDTLSRQAVAQDVRNKVLNYSNLLCEFLKRIVMATKMAALQYPSTAAVQDMVDKVTELSCHSHQFKVLLLHLASL